MMVFLVGDIPTCVAANFIFFFDEDIKMLKPY